MSTFGPEPGLPTLSILVPAFNQPEGAVKTIIGVSEFVNQWPGKVSVLLSDNASDDVKYQDELQPFIESGWLKVFQQRENLGFSGNVRFLANKADCDLSLILGCGDLVLTPHLMGVLVAVARRPTLPSLIVASVVAHVGDAEPKPPEFVRRELEKFNRAWSKWAPYQEAIPGQLYASVALKDNWPLTGVSGDTWPHVELALKLALDSNQTVFRYATPIVSMHQTEAEWYTQAGANFAAIKKHLLVLIPRVLGCSAALIKFSMLLLQGVPTALRQDSKAALKAWPTRKRASGFFR